MDSSLNRHDVVRSQLSNIDFALLLLYGCMGNDMIDQRDNGLVPGYLPSTRDLYSTGATSTLWCDDRVTTVGVTLTVWIRD